MKQISAPFLKKVGSTAPRLRRFAQYRCQCGTVKEILVESVTRGLSKSCGCEGSRATIGTRSFKHGMSFTRTHNAWLEMKRRCYDPNRFAYKDYGGRGIRVCKRWLASFNNFLKDMGECPDGHSIDRVNNSGDYKPSNCRWATPKQQANNRRPRKAKTHNLSPANCRCR